MFQGASGNTNPKVCSVTASETLVADSEAAAKPRLTETGIAGGAAID